MKKLNSPGEVLIGQSTNGSTLGALGAGGKSELFGSLLFTPSVTHKSLTEHAIVFQGEIGDRLRNQHSPSIDRGEETIRKETALSSLPSLR